MRLKHYAIAAGLVLALSAPAKAQDISAESLRSPVPEKSKVLRFDGFYGRGNFSTFGFLDFTGRFDSFYHELYLRQNMLGKSGLQVETNGGTGYGPVFRAGFITDIPSPKGTHIDMKFLPLNTKWGDLLAEFQAGIYGHADLPKGLYLDGWIDYTLAKKTKPSLLTEISAGKKLTDKISLQGQAAYNVGFNGWLSRAGIRYIF